MRTAIEAFNQILFGEVKEYWVEYYFRSIQHANSLKHKVIRKAVRCEEAQNKESLHPPKHGFEAVYLTQWEIFCLNMQLDNIFVFYDIIALNRRRVMNFLSPDFGRFEISGNICMN